MKGILFVLFGCLVFTSFSQSRVNRQSLSFSNSSEKLTSSKGWSYNKTLGEWVGYDNVIENNNDYNTKYISLRGEYMKSRRSQNFIEMKTKSLTINGEEYFVLMIEKYNGRYQYPSIQEDWYSWKETQGYIFNKIEYDKILDFEGEISLKTKYMISHGSKYDDFNEKTFLDLIQTEMGKEKSKYSPDYTFPILRTTSEGIEVIRFYVPDYFFLDYDFNKEYFETTPSEFDKIIIR